MRLHYVYILESQTGEHRYTGLTNDIARRLKEHNAGSVGHTSKYKPWKFRTIIGFNCRKRAAEFEKYLKTGSGRAFSIKRL
ncbi:GIY-YIG nuclease family protein [Hyphobacterium sp.]|jgi:predicted GIY-YIG superfamily endonuclease|uniref:GIY-YIG nuclease family protein n=1 Tax=Hyphobacterium sp. TaxID=2004662 RepID=UPI003BAA580A